MPHELSIAGGDGAVLHLRNVPETLGPPAHTLLELAMGDFVGRATFGADLAEALVGHARDGAIEARASDALFDIAAATVTRDWIAAELKDLGPLAPEQIDGLRAAFMRWRVQAAAHVFKAVAAAVAGNLHQPTPMRKPGRHVALCGEAGSAEAAADLCPERQVVRYGDQVEPAVWQSCLVLERPQSLADALWLHRNVAPRLGGCGIGVYIDGPTPPAPGQDRGRIVIAWNPEDLDEIAAELGTDAWVTLWGTGSLPAMLTRVVCYGMPRTRDQDRWYEGVLARAMTPPLMLPRPATLARPLDR